MIYSPWLPCHLVDLLTLIVLPSGGCSALMILLLNFTSGSTAITWLILGNERSRIKVSNSPWPISKHKIFLFIFWGEGWHLFKPMTPIKITYSNRQHRLRLLEFGSLDQLVETLGELDVFMGIHPFGVLDPGCFELTRIHDNKYHLFAFWSKQEVIAERNKTQCPQVICLQKGQVSNWRQNHIITSKYTHWNSKKSDLSTVQ